MAGPDPRTPRSDEGNGRRPAWAGWAVAIAATLGMSVSYIDRQTMAAIAPAVRTALSINHTQFGWLLSAFSMAYLVGAPAAGVVVDKLGARRGFAAAVLVWSIVACAHAFAFSFGALFVLRILLGAAESPSFPAAAQAIRRSMPHARRALAFGLLFTGSSIGSMIAAPLAIALEESYGFRFAFVGTALVGTLWIPLWLLTTRHDRIPAEDVAHAEEAAHDAHSAPSPYRGPSPRADKSMSLWALARTPAVVRAVIAVLGSAPVLMFVMNWTSLYLVDAWGLTRSSLGGYLVLAPLAFDLGAVGFGFLASRRVRAHAADGATPTSGTPVDLVLFAAGLASLVALAPLAPAPLLAVILFAASAAGGGGIYVLATTDMLSRVPLDKTSSAGGITAAAQSLAHIIVSPLVGVAIDRLHGYSAVLVGLGAIVVPTSIAFAFWPAFAHEREPQRGAR